ncbi:Unknown protein, partial [Striga hermonthica]
FPPSAQVDTSHNTATRHTGSVTVQTVPCCNGRIFHLHDRWIGLGESLDSVPGNLELDPRTYSEALQDKDADSWNVAMKAEMGSMDSNHIWDHNVIMYSIMLNFLNVQMPPRREPDHPAPTQATVVAQFRDYHAETFSGQGDPRIVDEWIQGLEFIFEVMECPDRYRVICAQLQLTGDARLWWNAYWSMRPGEKAGCTWDMLKELVREKYYPSYYRAEMERQFLALQQGTHTVDEYEREFTRLAAFVPDLVDTEAQSAQRFIDGLYPAV